MSLILKGIDLPKEGEEITLAIFHDGDIVSYKYWLPKEAEAIQIPTPHGRIGDLDELQNAIRTDIMGGLNYEYFIRNAPTILDEEGK